MFRAAFGSALINFALQVARCQTNCFYKDVISDTNTWSYDDVSATGGWTGACAEGQMQSPIDIARTDNVMMPFPELNMTNYASSPDIMRLSNTGYSVQIDVAMCEDEILELPRISGGGLNGTYTFFRATFHWGPSARHGSEHKKSKTQFPLEVQLMHFKSAYGDVMKASQQPDGFAGLAVLFQLSSDPNPRLDYFGDFLPNISRAQTSLLLAQPLPLTWLLPRFTFAFYRYHGSLTAPPCTENVIWTVFRDTVPITLKQISDFQSVISIGESTAFRPVQPKNDRPVYERIIKASASETRPGTGFIILAMLQLLSKD